MTKSQDDGFLEGVQDDEDDGFLSHIDEETGEDKVSYRPEVHFHSSEEMDELDDESVHLVVTSPPYNVGWEYGGSEDDLDYADEYLPMLASVFHECYKKLVPGGRMVVNIPSLVRAGADGGVPLSSDIVVMLQNQESSPWMHSYNEEQTAIPVMKSKTDWRIREIIQWVKGFNTDGLAPNGSYPRPWGVLLNNMHESALVLQKPGDRDVSDISDKRIEESKINKWTDELCDDVWCISPEAWSFNYVEGEDVPPFPEEFVKRCIAIWSYEGDTILDPFAGRFTVGKVAKQMNRHSVGYELREQLKKDIEEYTGMKQTGLDNW